MADAAGVTVNWPWMSRAHHETILAMKEKELDRALAQIERQSGAIAMLQDHNIRIFRRKAGLPEEPRSQRQKEDRDTIPVEVRRYIDTAFDSPEMRANVEDDIAMSRSQGTPWSEILALLAIDDTGEEDEI